MNALKAFRVREVEAPCPGMGFGKPRFEVGKVVVGL
jgi:hypothetical protein